MDRKRPAVAVAAALVVVVIGASFLIAGGSEDYPYGPAPRPDKVESRPSGGSVRVGVSTPPESSDTGDGGDTLRQLTLPSLFDAAPDGSWRASLVKSGSDRTARDAMSATFELHEAQWSNGMPIGVIDLQRSIDPRFVRNVTVDGNGVRVDFKQPFLNWRQLWSAIPAPAPGVTAGPFRVKEVVSGLETVLQRDDSWFGAGDRNQPFLDEVRIVVVSNHEIERELLFAGRLDVITPPVEAMRLQQFDRSGLITSRASEGGELAHLRLGPRLDVESRRAIAAQFPRKAFVQALLANEAQSLEGFDDVNAWSAAFANDARLDGEVEVFLSSDEAIATSLGKALEFAAEARGGSARITTFAGDIAEARLGGGDYDVVFDSDDLRPSFCWQCSFEEIDPSLAALADSGDRAAAERLLNIARDEALLVPLWRAPTMVVARNQAAKGVVANGFAIGSAWGAEGWYVEN